MRYVWLYHCSHGVYQGVFCPIGFHIVAYLKIVLFSEIVTVVATSWRQQVSNLMVQVENNAAKNGVWKLIMVFPWDKIPKSYNSVL